MILRSAGLIKLMLKQQELLASKLGPDLSWEEPQQPSAAIREAAVMPTPAALPARGSAWREPGGAARSVPAPHTPIATASAGGHG